MIRLHDPSDGVPMNGVMAGTSPAMTCVEMP